MNEKKILEIQNISFSYGENKIFSDFSLSVERGSFTTLLGPSGCGKTTLLRIIAGFINPDSGSVVINGKDVTKLPVEKRKIGFVFQDYALFPHLTVKENLLFGFSFGQKKAVSEELKKITESLGLENLLERFPHEISGGQQQRVALGRTLMLKPEIILMDEPLSSLDAKLRLHVRQELQEIQKKIGITTVYVTHDQEEALSLSTDIAVINEGKLLQFDSPRNIYFSPADKTTASFTGMSNILNLNDKEIMVRPEWILLGSAENETEVKGKIQSVSFLGGVTRYKISCPEAENGFVYADEAFGPDRKVEDSVSLSFRHRVEF